MLRIFVTALAAGPILAALAVPACAQRFADDEHTLLLATYNTGIDADRAVASPLATGRAELVETPCGRGIHASKGWFEPSMTLLDFERFPLFVPLTYAAANLDPRQGTLEMFVWIEKVVNPEYFQRLMTYGTQQVFAFLALRPTPEQRTLIAYIEHGDGAQTVAVDFPYDWNEQWHHVGMQWDAEHLGVIVDDKLVGQRTLTTPGLPKVVGRIAIGGHERGVNTTEGIIDELRISAVPRYLW